jgi:hypothetical protein
MKRRVLVLLVLLSLASSTTHAALVIFSDAAMTDSTINDNGPQIVSFYVAEVNPDGNTGLRFSTEASAGFTGVWLGDTSPFVTVGSSPTDISVGYGWCFMGGTLHVLTATYQLFGTSAPCSELRIAAADGFAVVLAGSSGCLFGEMPIRDLGGLHVNCPVATEPTTWGKVKALYRN